VTNVNGILAHRRVLEIACGTGYWTAIAADVAQHIVAIDDSDDTLAIAREKDLAPDKVEFCRGNAYALDTIVGTFDAGLANFWFSHIPRDRIGEFLSGFHRRLAPDGSVFMADNVYVPGIGGELVRRTGEVDTYKLRKLADGSTFEILKNYYTFGELRDIFEPQTNNLRVHVGECYWWIGYEVRGE